MRQDADVIPFVWSESVLLHDPGAAVFAGRPVPAAETPARATEIRRALAAAGHPELPAAPTTTSGDDALARLHELGLLEYLLTTAQTVRDGEEPVVPYVFPTPMMTGGLPWRYPSATAARAGVWAYDTATPVAAGTWEAARAAVDVALTAADLVAIGASSAAYALTRPPGHHATPTGFGGACYLNNAAVAADRLAATGRRVAIIDIDAHHGNGTQAIFWSREDVFYGSVHVDPGAGWFPHFLGHADETGPVAGGNRNIPLAPGAGDVPWIEAVTDLAEAALRFRADALVVSLGLDAADDDASTPLRVSDRGFASAGRILADVNLPTVIVQEGGVHLPTLGELVVKSLGGFNARAS
jgi:acetoin utilization deacetylase AcuC-like enzyme